MRLHHLLPVVLLGRVAAEAAPAEAVITAAPAPRAAVLQPRQSLESNQGRSRELSDVFGLGIYSTRDCPQFQEPEFESSVIACFSSLVGGGDDCEYGDKAEWLYARRTSLVERFARCVCPVAEVVADSCLVGCPRHFTDVSIKQRWGDICATQPTLASTGGSQAASATSAVDEPSASSTDSEGAEETTGSAAGDDDSAAASVKASVWIVPVLIALALR